MNFKNKRSYYLEIKTIFNKNRLLGGFMAVSTVILISAVVLVITTTVTLTSINESQASFALNKGEANLALVEGCAEDALLKARSSDTFGNPTGSVVNITTPETTCVITVLSKVGTNPVVWTMNVSTSAVSNQRKVQIIFNRYTNQITLNSWREI